MDLPAFSAYDAKEPQAFYLGPDPEFALLADATMFGQGSCGQLPVHSHIVSMHSRVLKTLFAAVREGGAVQEDVWLKECFTGFSVYAVAALLRFMYQPEDACASHFKQLGKTLPSVARLAHQLDCPRLLSKLDAYLSGTGKRGRMDTATVEDAVSWAMMAEDCKLSKLRMQALRQVARALATKPCGPSQPRCGSAKSGSIYSYSPPAAVKSPNVNQIVASTSALKGLSQESLLVVMSAFVAAGQRANIASYLPTTDDMLAAMTHLD